MDDAVKRRRQQWAFWAGVAVAILALNFWATRQADRPRMVYVLVARHRLDPGTFQGDVRLDPSVFDRVERPASEVPADAVTDYLFLMDGKHLTKGMEKGAILTARHTVAHAPPPPTNSAKR